MQKKNNCSQKDLEGFAKVVQKKPEAIFLHLLSLSLVWAHVRTTV